MATNGTTTMNRRTGPETVTNVKVGDRLIGKGRGEVIAITRTDDVIPPRIYFDYALEADRATAPWESFQLAEVVVVEVKR